MTSKLAIVRVAWLVALLSAIPVTDQASARKRADRQTITLETAGCFWGTCPGYTITLQPDGTGTFVGRVATSMIGERRFTATPAQVTAFATRVARYRPKTGNINYEGKLCRQMWTDQSGVTVTWQSATAKIQHVYYYAGCDPKRHAKMAEAFFTAYKLLPVAEWVEKVERPAL